jgi:hypothetical protein
MIPKPKKSESLSEIKDRVWHLCSEYVRRSAADWRGYATCVTCGKKKETFGRICFKCRRENS